MGPGGSTTGGTLFVQTNGNSQPPYQMAFDSSGNLYYGGILSDLTNSGVVRVTPGGSKTDFASITSAYSLAFDTTGNLFVTSSVNGGSIAKVGPGGSVSTFVSNPGVTGVNLAFDSSGNLYGYFEGSFNSVVKITPGGTITTFASVRPANATPFGMAFDSNGNLYVTTGVDGLVDKITPSGSVSTFANIPGSALQGLAIDSSNNVYVADSSTGSILEIAPDGSTSTFASGFLIGTPVGLAFGPQSVPEPSSLILTAVSALCLFASRLLRRGKAALLVLRRRGVHFLGRFVGRIRGAAIAVAGVYTPRAARLTARLLVVCATFFLYAARSRADLLYVSVQNDPSPNGSIFTVGPSGTTTGGTPFVATTADSQPAGLAFDSSGNLYVANGGNGTVSRVTPGGSVSTFASGFSAPQGLAFDGSGNLYVANLLSNTVSEVTPGGSVSTFVSGLHSPTGLAFDSSGNLYIANYGSGTVSKVTPGGSVSTFASGFGDTLGLAFDSSSNLYVANANANTVNKVTPGGSVSTFASGFNQPTGLAFDSSGNLYVANHTGNTVSEVTPGGVVSTFASGFPSGLENPGPAFLAFQPQNVPEPSSLILTAVSALCLFASSLVRRGNAALLALRRRGMQILGQLAGRFGGMCGWHT